MNSLPNLKDILFKTFQNLITQFSDFVPKLIGSIVILVIGTLVARVTASVLKKVLSQIGIDKVGDKINQIDAIKGLNIEIKLSNVISKILYYFINLIFVIAAADTLGVPAISNMVLLLVTFIPKVISAAIMMLAGILLADAMKSFVITLCQSFKIAAAKLIGSAVFFFLLVITLIASLGQAGINTSLLESSFNLLVGGIIFAFAIGYGFASKEILVNILASFYSRNKFKEGQTIEIDGVKGTILSLDNTNITLQTGDTKTIFPLQALQTKKIVVFD